jgi:hypothetical protein
LVSISRCPDTYELLNNNLCCPYFCQLQIAAAADFSQAAGDKDFHCNAVFHNTPARDASTKLRLTGTGSVIGSVPMWFPPSLKVDGEMRR